MAVVRELVTLLKFDVDRKGIQNFEKSLLGVKTRFALTAGGIGAAIAGTLAAFSSVANSTREIVELARNTGIAAEDFIALREAASNLGLDRTQFDQVFSGLATQINQAQRGFGALFDLQRKSLGKANIFPFINNNDTVGAFRALLAYVRTINDVQTQIRILSDHFGAGNANALLRIVNASPEELDRLTKSYEDYAAQVIKTQGVQEQYLQNVQELNTNWQKLKTTFTNFAFPSINQAVEFTNDAFNYFEKVEKKAEQEGNIAATNLVAADATNGFYKVLRSLNLISDETVENARKIVSGEVNPFEERLTQSQGLNNSPVITMQNDININVPAGTIEEQSKTLAQVVVQEFYQLMDKTVREVINNNPQTQ